MDNQSSLIELIKKNRVIIVLGSGGVGKTTTAMALAAAASQIKGKVGLISIDPAKRLADAMGIELGYDMKKINLPNGTLWAAMLDQKAVFDQVVGRFAPSKKIFQKILDNKIYQSISANLGGPQEFMALAKLSELADQDYDCIIVDTPPDTHALDFLNKPSILGDFMDRRVMTWMIKPFSLAQKLGIFKAVSAGEKLMFGLAKVTGLKMLQSLAEFLVLMESTISGLHRSGETVKGLLQQDNTCFLLVTTATTSGAISSVNIADQLEQHSYHLDHLIFNREVPQDLKLCLSFYDDHKESLSELEPLLASLKKRYGQQQKNADVIKRHCQSLFSQTLHVSHMDEQATIVHDLSTLTKFARTLVSGDNH